MACKTRNFLHSLHSNEAKTNNDEEVLFLKAEIDLFFRLDWVTWVRYIKPLTSLELLTTQSPCLVSMMERIIFMIIGKTIKCGITNMKISISSVFRHPTLKFPNEKPLVKSIYFSHCLWIHHGFPVTLLRLCS